MVVNFVDSYPIWSTPWKGVCSGGEVVVVIFVGYFVCTMELRAPVELARPTQQGHRPHRQCIVTGESL